MAADNSKGIIALNAVVSGTENVKNLRTQLDAIIKTGGGRVKLVADMVVTGTEQAKQAIASVGRAYQMLNENVAASLRFLEQAVIKTNSLVAAGRTPTLLGVRGVELDRGQIRGRLTGQVSRLTGISQQDVSQLRSIYRQAEILSGVIAATNRYDPSREQTALFERVNRSLKSYNRRAITTGSPRIPMTLEPGETQEAAIGALYNISQQLGALVPRRAIQYLPPGSAVAMANPNFLRKSLYQRIAGRIGGIEATQFNIPQQYVRAAELYGASFGKYPDSPKIRVIPQIATPTVRGLLGPGSPESRMTAVEEHLFAERMRTNAERIEQIRATLGYSEFQSLRPDQYTNMIAPGLTGLNTRFTNLISSPLAMASLARRGITGASLRGAAGRQDLKRSIGEDIGEGGIDPFLSYYASDPYGSGRSFSDVFSGGRNRQRPLADEAALISQIYRLDPFQKTSGGRQNLRFSQERYFNELKSRDPFQGAFGYSQFTPGGGLGGPGGPGGPGRAGVAGEGAFGRFGQRFAGLAYYTAAASIIYPIISVIEKSIKRAVELEVIVKRIQGIYGNTTLGDQLNIRKEIVGVALRYSADLLETARTAQLFAQEGLKPEQFRGNLEAVARGSVGLGISQEGLANYVIAIRNATGGTSHPVEGQEAVNLVTSFVRRGAVSPQNIMTAIQQVLPVLETFTPSQANVSDPALIGSITSLIARRSSFTGSQVSNSLRFLIARFGSPETTAKIERISGVQLGTAESGGEQLRPFINIMTDLAEAFNKLETSGQTARASELIRTLFSTRQAGIGTIALRNWVQLLKDAKIAMDDYGSSAELAAIQQDALARLWERITTVTTNFVGGRIQNGRNNLNRIIDSLEPIWNPELRQTFPDVSSLGANNIFNPLAPGTDVGSILRNAFPPLGRKKPGTGQAGKVIIPEDETAPLFLDFSHQWDAYYTSYLKFRQGVSGQTDVMRDLGNSLEDPRSNLTELTRELETFYTVAGDRLRAGKLGSLSPEILDVRAYLRGLLPKAQTEEVIRRSTDFDAQYGLQIQAEQRRYNFQTSRMRLRLLRTFGKKGLTDTIGGRLQEQLDEVGANRLFDITEQQLSFPEALRRLQRTTEYKSDPAGARGRAEKERQLRLEYDKQILITENKYTQLALEADINAQYETRVKYLQQVESLAQDINNVLKNALIQYPGQTKKSGSIPNFLGSIVGASTAILYKSVIDNIDLFGKKGLFPGIGRKLNEIVGPPTDLTAIKIDIPTVGGGSISVPVQTPEQYKRLQKQAQIRAMEIAVASSIGAYVGKGGPGAQVGGQLGAIGGLYAGAKLGAAGGPIGALVGGIVGGLIGGIFDKKKPVKPELVALEKIARNTGEQVTLIENTNRLLELQNVAFNVPTGFNLPIYNPSLNGGIIGGQPGIVSNSINIEVNVGMAKSSATEIGQVVAQTVSDRLDLEYRNAGKYVSRTKY